MSKVIVRGAMLGAGLLIVIFTMTVASILSGIIISAYFHILIGPLPQIFFFILGILTIRKMIILLVGKQQDFLVLYLGISPLVVLAIIGFITWAFFSSEDMTGVLPGITAVFMTAYSIVVFYYGVRIIRKNDTSRQLKRHQILSDKPDFSNVTIYNSP